MDKESFRFLREYGDLPFENMADDANVDVKRVVGVEIGLFEPSEDENKKFSKVLNIVDSVSDCDKGNSVQMFAVEPAKEDKEVDEKEHLAARERSAAFIKKQREELMSKYGLTEDDVKIK